MNQDTQTAVLALLANGKPNAEQPGSPYKHLIYKALRRDGQHTSTSMGKALKCSRSVAYRAMDDFVLAGYATAHMVGREKVFTWVKGSPKEWVRPYRKSNRQRMVRAASTPAFSALLGAWS